MIVCRARVSLLEQLIEADLEIENPTVSLCWVRSRKFQSYMTPEKLAFLSFIFRAMTLNFVTRLISISVLVNFSLLKELINSSS